jgi:hypothetical protein
VTDGDADEDESDAEYEPIVSPDAPESSLRFEVKIAGPTPDRLAANSPTAICDAFAAGGLELVARDWLEVLETADKFFRGCPGYHGAPFGGVTIRGDRDKQEEPLASEVFHTLRALNIGAFGLANATGEKYRKWAAVSQVSIAIAAAAAVTAAAAAAAAATAAARAGKRKAKKKAARGAARAKRSKGHKTGANGKFGAARTGPSIPRTHGARRSRSSK